MLRFLSPNSPLGRWMIFFLDALLISLAWTICSIPILTIGASTAALHVIARNWMLKRTDCDLKTFFRAFRGNLRRGTVVWSILLIPMLLLLYTAYTVWFSTAEVPAPLHWMTAAGVIIWMAIAVYAFPLQAIFENTPIRTVTNAMRIAAAHLLPTLILLLLFGVALFCTVLFPPGAFCYIPIAVFLSARVSWNVFKKLVPCESTEEFEKESKQ